MTLDAGIPTDADAETFDLILQREFMRDWERDREERDRAERRCLNRVGLAFFFLALGLVFLL